MPDASGRVLPERIRCLVPEPPAPGRPVAYWMGRDQRATDNWALIRAQDLALEARVPLLVLFCLAPDFSGASAGHYRFMLAGLRETAAALAKKHIPFMMVRGEPAEAMPRVLRKMRVGFLVTDFDPLRTRTAWVERVVAGAGIPAEEVDAHNIVPCRTASAKREFGAYTIRPKIQARLPRFLGDYPDIVSHPFALHEPPAPPDFDALLRKPPGFSYGPSAYPVAPGTAAGLARFGAFIERGLDAYAGSRNDPVADSQSGMSPYLHFGQVSAQRLAFELMMRWPDDAAAAAYLEELVVRRELSDNFCLHEPLYDRFEGFPAWARATLDAHRADPRPFRYALPALESASTHDRLWNAAQVQLMTSGRMHGYLRMYWAKKILEWSASPESALDAAIVLNDRYSLDGRDPNGYAGMAWSIGGVHDRAWFDRPVFGKIRFMSHGGCASKFDVAAYIARWDADASGRNA